MPHDEGLANHPKTDMPPKGAGSLSDYIAEHLKNHILSTRTSPDTMPQPGIFVQPENPYVPLHKKHSPSGTILHHLDSQLANDHLERFLPVPATRLHMELKRIESELNTLEEELIYYRGRQGAEYRQKVVALENRILFLQDKRQSLEKSLIQLNPFQSLCKRFQKPTSAAPRKTTVPRWVLLINPQRQLRDEVEMVNQDLQTLQHILETQLHDPCFTSDQLGYLVSQYDVMLKRAERLQSQWQGKKTLITRLKEKLADWCQRLQAQLQAGPN